MKKNIALIAILFAGWTIVPSCTSNHPEEIQRIETMMQELNTAQHHIDSIDVEVLTSRYKASEAQILFLNKNYKSDTISRETALMLGNYRSNYKSLKKLKKLYDKLSYEITFTEKQLENLKTDLKNDKLTDEMIVEYFESEEKAMDFINKKSSSLYTRQSSAIRTNKGIKPKIDSIISEMNRNGIR